MTLEEHIKRYDDRAKSIRNAIVEKKESQEVVELLRELKAYREELPKEIKNVKVRQADALEANVKNENYNSHLAEYIKGYLCGLSYTEGIIAKMIEEVNADGLKKNG
jgi:pantothenate synthetase